MFQKYNIIKSIKEFDSLRSEWRNATKSSNKIKTFGTELAFKQYFGTKSLKVGLGASYENELGRVANVKNKARVADTNANWFNIRGEKEDRTGNVKFDLNVGFDNQIFGVTGNVSYDTKGQNVRGGVGLRVIF